MSTLNPLIVLKDPLEVSSRNVRDSIIGKIDTLFLNQTPPSFVKPFLEHLRLMGSSKLDRFAKIVFVLEEFGIRLEIQTGIVGGESMIYTLVKNSKGPPPELKRTKFLGLF